MTDPTLELLLARADDQSPSLPGGLPLSSVGSAPRPSQAYPESLRYDSGDADDLRRQRWGIVAPSGAEGDALMAAVKPLIDARAEEQGSEVIVYRVPSGMDAEASIAWENKVYWDEARDEADLPRYLVILGDLDQVSVELQQALSTDTFTGRLAFGAAADYGAYAAKVLRAERRAREASSRLLFFTARDGTAATSIGHRALVAPSVERCASLRDRGVLGVGEISAIPYDPIRPWEPLWASINASSPSILLSVSHGLGPPRGGFRSVDEQRALQGAMVLGPRARITAEHAARGPFLPDGVWFFVACYGGAVPSESAYYDWLRRLKEAGMFPGRADAVLEGLPKAGERPFVSALPRAALANPEGPLAVLAHADLAWTYSFQDIGAETTDRPSRFFGIFRALADGGRVGPAHRELLRFMTEKNEELLILLKGEERGIAEDQGRRVRKANLWMARQDIAGYLLLGDPAVRLAVQERRLAPPPPPPSSGAARMAALVGGPSQRPLPAGALRDAASMERAVIDAIIGERGVKAIIEEHGIRREDLDRWVSAYRAAGRDALGALAKGG